MLGLRGNSRCGPTAASTPTPWSPSVARRRSASEITIRQRASLRNVIEAIPEADWRPIPYWMDGAADVLFLVRFRDSLISGGMITRTACGHEENADINASRVIAQRGLAKLKERALKSA